MTKLSDELAALVERATPGPWGNDSLMLSHGNKMVCAFWSHNDYGDWKDADNYEANRAFIVWCRNNADQIIEALKRMEAGDADRG